MIRYRRSLAVGIGGVLIASVFLVRTDLVIGQFVAQKISQIARKQNVEIEVGSMKPAGLTGVTFSDVAISFQRSGQGVDAVFAHVTVFPTLSFSPQIRSVELSGGYATLRPAEKRVVLEPKKKAAVSTGAKSASLKVAPPETIAFTIDDLQIELPYAVAPVRIAHAEGDATRSKLVGIQGYGTLPNGATYAVDTKDGVFNLRSDQPIKIADNVRDLPVPDLQIERVEFCPSCDVPASFKGARLQIGESTFSSPTVGFRREAQRYSVELDEVAYDAVPARIVEWRAGFSADGNADGKVRIEGTNGGTLDVRWSLDERASLDISAKRFRLFEWDEVNPYRDVALAQIVTGRASIDFDPTTNIGSVDVSVEADDARIHIYRIAKDPIELPKLGFDANFLFDVDAKTVSVNQGRLGLEASDPISFHGYATDATRGLVFNLRVDAPRLNAVVVRDALPKSMTRVLSGANIDGDFGFWLEVAGHTSFPDGLHLDGELTGDVKILTDAPSANVFELRGTGAPKLDSVKTKTWVAYDQFPAIAPAVLLAAEDAQFFRHDGFDWPGFQRAMIHNLREGELERGASTLTQQVIKNLYLGGERTISRKIQEMYLTWRIESEIEKERILEIYLNIAAWGPGVYGLPAAAQYYFSDSIMNLTVPEMALLTAILPNPFIFGASITKGRLPLGRLQKYEHIIDNLRFVQKIDGAQYRLWLKEAKTGKFGRLQLTLCDDGTVSQLAENLPTCESLR